MNEKPRQFLLLDPHSGRVLAILKAEFVPSRGVTLQITLKRFEDDDRVDGPPDGDVEERGEVLVACSVGALG